MSPIPAKTAGLTDPGLKREGNEDFYSADDILGLYVVADGMGGHLAGEVASRMAVGLINKCFREWFLADASVDALFGYPDPSLSKYANRVSSSIRLANRVIYEMALQQKEYRGMGTTVAVLAVIPGLIISANVGDSRIYLVRNGQIERLSKDHTIIAEQVEMGILSIEDAENSPMKHVLTRNLGSSKEVDAEILELAPTNNDRFVLCTDGVTDLISDDEILQMVEGEDNPEALCGHFIEEALERGGHDNATVISVYLPRIEKPKFRTMKKFGRSLSGILTSKKK
jgi:serine/threonine protein phosphatase PrpC